MSITNTNTYVLTNILCTAQQLILHEVGVNLHCNCTTGGTIVFTLPGDADEHLTYNPAPDPDHSVLRLNHVLNGDSDHVASIVPVSSIRFSAHLFPKFGPEVPEHWTSANVLEKCTTFYPNPFSDRHMRHRLNNLLCEGPLGVPGPKLLYLNCCFSLRTDAKVTEPRCG